MRKPNFLQRLLQGLKNPAPQPSVAPPVMSTPAPQHKTENHQVSGVKYYTDAVMALAEPNPAYQKTQTVLQREGFIGKTVFEYKWPLCTAELVPEPENPHSPKAIKVLANGLHIGYIKEGSCARIHKLIQAGKIDHLTCEIGGGKGKMLIPDENSSRERYLLKPAGTVLWAKVNIQLKPEN